jgi:hypothetical protein
MRSERCCAIARHLMTLVQDGLMTHSGNIFEDHFTLASRLFTFHREIFCFLSTMDGENFR